MYKLQNNRQIILLMNKIFLAFLICFFLQFVSKENNDYFKRGQENFNKKNIDKAKLNFEKI